jgi:hypothetical protein
MTSFLDMLLGAFFAKLTFVQPQSYYFLRGPHRRSSDDLF